jgi:integrase
VEQWLDKPLGRATVRDLERLKPKLRAMASGPQYVRLMRMFYIRAKREDVLPILVLKQRKHRLSPDDVLTPKDVQALIDATPGARDKALIGVLWDTGSRIHEVLSVSLRDVSETKEGYRIFFRKAKVAGEEHSGWVMDTAAVLRAWLKAHPWRTNPDAKLFPAFDGAALTRHGGGHVVEKAARKSGIAKRIYPHLFRHSRATHLLRLGMSEFDVKRLLGWAPSSTMLNRYAHLRDVDAYRALLKIQGYDVPEMGSAETMAFEDADLKPVVPLLAPPGKRHETISSPELDELLADPNVLRFLRLLESARARPRA